MKRVRNDLGRVTLRSFTVFGRVFSCSFRRLRGDLSTSYLGVVVSCGDNGDNNGIFGHHIESEVYSLDHTLTTARGIRRFGHALARFCGRFKINGLKLRGTFHIRRPRGSSIRVVPVAGVTRMRLSSLMNCRSTGGGLISGAGTFMRKGGTGGYLVFKSTKAKGSSSVGTVLGRCCSRKLHVVRICGRRFRSLGSMVTRVGGEGCGFVVCVSSLSFRRFRVRCGCLGTIVRNNLRGGPGGILVCTASGHHRLVHRAFHSGRSESRSVRAGSAMRRGLSLITEFNIAVCFNSPSGGTFRRVMHILTGGGKVGVPRRRLLLRTGT